MLVHDTFSWGSRRFDLSRPTPRLAALLEAQNALWRQQGVQPTDDERFDVVSGWHEDTLAKAAGALGQTFAGAVLADDLVALRVLAATDGVDPARLGTFGFSGGGGRSLLLAALDHRVAACGGQLHDGHLRLAGPGRAGHPLLAAPRARPVVADRLAGPDRRWGGPGSWSSTASEDELFPPAGMEAAHAHLLRRHAGTARYRGSFHPGGHVFDAAMQDEAWAFLAEAL